MSSDPGRSLISVLERVRLAPPQSAKWLTIWPLVGEANASPRDGIRIATLAQALEDGFVSVQEHSDTSDRGPVSELRIGNRACDPVLIVFSEELHAESGSLIADESVLLPPASELEICVHSEGKSDHPEEKGDHPEEAVGFSLVEKQIGFVAVIGGEVVGLEVMDDVEIFASSYETLLRPYALDAREAELAPGGADSVLDPLFDTPEAFLAALATSHAVASPTAGLGCGLRLAGPGLAGCALEAGGIVHLSAYPLEVAWAA